MNTFNIGQANAAHQIIGDNAHLSIGEPASVPDLGALEAAIRDNRSLLADPSAVDQALRLLREQISGGNPDPAAVRPLLGVITNQAGGIPSVVTAAATLRRLADG